MHLQHIAFVMYVTLYGVHDFMGIPSFQSSFQFLTSGPNRGTSRSACGAMPYPAVPPSVSGSARARSLKYVTRFLAPFPCSCFSNTNASWYSCPHGGKAHRMHRSAALRACNSCPHRVLQDVRHMGPSLVGPAW